MDSEKNPLAGTAPDVREVVLGHVNAAPAQTWNRLRANDVTLTVPSHTRKGDVYFALPRLFDRVECGMGDDVTAWACSQAAGARYVEVPAHTRREEPIVVSVSADEGEVADAGVMVREGAEATVVVVSTGSEGVEGTSGALVRVIAEAGARVSVFELVGVGSSQQHLESVGISADEGARVEVRQFALGGATCAMGLACDLAGRRSRIDLSCRYHASDAQTLDVNHIVRMRGRDTRAEVAESGVLDDAARKSLRATIDLVHGARGAQGNEAETVLVLGDDVVNKTVPVILCDEDDVAGNHGATIGSVSPEQISYLMNRGLSREEAERLFVRAVYEDALIHAPEPVSRAAALACASRALGVDAGEWQPGPDAGEEAC